MFCTCLGEGECRLMFSRAEDHNNHRYSARGLSAHDIKWAVKLQCKVNSPA